MVFVCGNNLQTPRINQIHDHVICTGENLKRSGGGSCPLFYDLPPRCKDKNVVS